MNIDSIRLVFFSPTGTTERVVRAISRGIGVAAIGEVDLTPPDGKASRSHRERAGMTVIGVPVYGGRIPGEAVRRLRDLDGHGWPAVLVAVYGNREYEDALRELRDVAVELGFVPIAAGVFIGEHSFHTEARPIAAGRPDVGDLLEAERFGTLIREKMDEAGAVVELPPPAIPGEGPYREPRMPSGISPETVEALCVLCGTCSEVCPTGAVTVGGTVVTERRACILCSACVKECPTEARVWQAEWVEKVATWLNTHCRRRREPEFFL
jgi:ferredoxin